MPPRCADCGEASAAAFSQRMLRRTHGAVRCKACVAIGEQAERAAAASRQATAADELHRCAGCGRKLPASAYSRSQLLQKGDARRCTACVGGASTTAAEDTASLLQPPTDQRALLERLRAQLPPPPGPPLIALEQKRLSKMKRLRRLLVRLCAAGGPPPVLAFDKWVSRQKLREALARLPPLDCVPPPEPLPAVAEPLLPVGDGADAALAKELGRGGRLDAAAAQHAAAELAAASARAAAQLAAADAEAEPAVQLEVSGATVRLRAAGVDRYVELRASHLQKLRDLHAGGDDASFHRAVLRLLLRYDALGARGSQCALSDGVFRVLRTRLGVGFECFASPLNCRFAHYCSAFADTDAPFGAFGSFFDLSPTEGSFEANPPFVPEVMLAAVAHAEALVSRADAAGAPLSFVFVVPEWGGLPFHRRLLASRWRRGEALSIGAEAHGFVDGAQHVKGAADLLRESSFATTVAVLQSAAGAARWPATAEAMAEVREAFKAALPSADDAAARRKRGGGDAVAKLLRRREAAAGGDGREKKRARPNVT